MSLQTNKSIWIDLDNSPHIPFFRPIIRELEKKGHTVFLTARDCFQTCGLADRYHFQYKRIGRHYGKNKLMKVFGLLVRSAQLAPTIMKERPAIALSHGSRSQLVLSLCLGIPTVVITDYEHAKELINPTWLMTPEVIPPMSNMGKTRFLNYPGIKEDVYVPDFKPEPGIRGELGLGEDDIVVTVRPPANEAHYHNPESELLFEAAVESLASRNDVRMVMLPRNDNQAKAITHRWPGLCSNGKVVIPRAVVDGLNLIWHSDLVISGGGTMNREAAALGVPVYSVFRGKIGAVDRFLAKEGRLTLLESVDDVKSKISTIKRDKGNKTGNGESAALKKIVSNLEDVVQEVGG